MLNVSRLNPELTQHLFHFCPLGLFHSLYEERRPKLNKKLFLEYPVMYLFPYKLCIDLLYLFLKTLLFYLNSLGFFVIRYYPHQGRHKEYLFCHNPLSFGGVCTLLYESLLKLLSHRNGYLLNLNKLRN